MTDLSNVSTQDLYDALHRRGIYEIVTLSAEDILDEAEEQGVTVTEEQAKKAALMIWRDYDVAPEFSEILEVALTEAKGL